MLPCRCSLRKHPRRPRRRVGGEGDRVPSRKPLLLLVGGLLEEPPNILFIHDDLEDSPPTRSLRGAELCRSQCARSL